MVSALHSALGGQALAVVCVAFLGKTLYSHSASFHPGVYMGTINFTSGGNPAID